MNTPTIKACLLALPVAVSLAMATPSFAADNQVKPYVPIPTNDISGCWTADHQLYGSYQLSFCVHNGIGNYRISGGGLNCTANISFMKIWNGYDFVMNRSQCGNGTDWSADRFNCTLQLASAGDGEGDGGWVPDIFSHKLKPYVPVHNPGPYVLSCSYRPAVAGWGAESFTAWRG